MSRNPRHIAALLAGAALFAAATSAAAWPFGGSSASTSPPAAGDKTQTGPQKATPEQRAAANRLDPLARAAFWQHELNIDPKDPEAGVALAVALRQLGRYDEAADTAERMLLFSPKNEDALLESARAHIAAGHGFYAIGPLKQAEALYPKDWRPVSLMGVALEQDERPDEAFAAYNKALKMSPNNPAVLTNLGLFYAQRGDQIQAEMLMRQAAAQPGATAQERQNLALVLGLNGKLTEAEHLIRQDLPPEAADADLAYLKASMGHVSLTANAEPATQAGPAPQALNVVQ